MNREEKIQFVKNEYASIWKCDVSDFDSSKIEAKLREHGKKLAGEHVGYLHLFPEKEAVKPSGLTYEWYRGEEICRFYHYKEFDNAMTFKNRDKIAVAAYDGEQIVGMAGCDDYMDSIWQIGVDVLPKYRNNKLGAFLVKELALEIEKNEKVAYYNTWSPNIASTRLALSVGFYPTWVSYFSEDC